MKHVSVADVQANRSAILDGVQAGDEFIITRHGEEIARLGAIQPPLEHLSLSLLKQHTMSTPLYQGSSVVDMRKEDRY